MHKHVERNTTNFKLFFLCYQADLTSITKHELLSVCKTVQNNLRFKNHWRVSVLLQRKWHHTHGCGASLLEEHTPSVYVKHQWLHLSKLSHSSLQTTMHQRATIFRDFSNSCSKNLSFIFKGWLQHKITSAAVFCLMFVFYLNPLTPEL